jgi:flagellin-like protein
MKRIAGIVTLVMLVAAVVLVAGCKKRYIPRVTEEIVDPGVPVYEEMVVE